MKGRTIIENYFHFQRFILISMENTQIFRSSPSLHAQECLSLWQMVKPRNLILIDDF